MDGWGRTIEQQTLEGLLYVELCVEDDEPEADGEGVVAGAALEEAADGAEGGVVCGDVGGGPVSGRGPPLWGAGGLGGGEGRHPRVVAIYGRGQRITCSQPSLVSTVPHAPPLRQPRRPRPPRAVPRTRRPPLHPPPPHRPLHIPLRPPPLPRMHHIHPQAPGHRPQRRRRPPRHEP